MEGRGFFAILPEKEKDAVVLMQNAAKSAGVPIAGTIFPELVMDNKFVSKGVWLVCFEEMPKVWLFDGLPADAGENAKFVAGMAEEFNGYLDSLGVDGDATLLMFFDVLIPNIGTMLDGLYSRMADRVNYLGASAGSISFRSMPCLFDNDRVVTGGLLALMLLDHRGGVLEHGYGTPEKIIHATTTNSNRIAAIDWKPAFDVYRELVLNEYGVEITKDNFYENAAHFPFGIMRANGSVLVRCLASLADDGSLFSVGEIPANSVMTLLKLADLDSGTTVETLYNGLHAIYPVTQGRDLLLFFCASRRLHLEEEGAVRELSNYMSQTKARRVAGALSLGEIGSSTREGGYPLFHNAALVATVI